MGVAVDAGGALFIADTDNYRIRAVGAAVSPSNTPSPSSMPAPPGPGRNYTINTFAGNGQQGAGGNGGPATSASFHFPYVPAPVLYAGGPQPVGSVLIVDTANNQFRVVSPGGASAALRMGRCACVCVNVGASACLGIQPQPTHATLS